MALLDRVKERAETDLSDAELQRLIDEANGEIMARHGRHADPVAPITVTLSGGTHFLSLFRPIDVAQAVAVVETVRWGWWWGVPSPVTLLSTDYLVLHGGRTLERLTSGTYPRYRWGDRVAVTYTPVADGNQRQEVIIKLVLLAIQYDATSSVGIGDYRKTNVDYYAARERLLASVEPRKGLLFR